jgi:hypothetical protein
MYLYPDNQCPRLVSFLFESIRAISPADIISVCDWGSKAWEVVVFNRCQWVLLFLKIIHRATRPSIVIDYSLILGQ